MKRLPRPCSGIPRICGQLIVDFKEVPSLGNLPARAIAYLLLYRGASRQRKRLALLDAYHPLLAQLGTMVPGEIPGRPQYSPRREVTRS